ncbi:MAG: shikimate dehydrogenase, partial [Spirochaetia bacterium]
NPVAHSKSPRIHNRWLKSLGLNAVYIPFLVDDPAAFFRLAEVLPIEGFSVTLPHKEKVIPFLHRLEHPVKKIGACNTVFRKEGKWVGTNTDYEGFLSPIETLLREGSIQSALVIGAGGAARTVVHALCDRGVRVQICNRTAVKAEELAKEAGCGHVLQEEVNSSGPYDLVVQTTNVGMEPDIEGDPLPGYRFTGRETVYDIIYTPEKTVFLRRAEERGCKIIGGAQMLRKQAEAQFRIFTGGMNPPDY